MLTPSPTVNIMDKAQKQEKICGEYVSCKFWGDILFPILIAEVLQK